MTCHRCNDTGAEVWSGRIIPRHPSGAEIMGPCLRCRWRYFWTAYNTSGDLVRLYRITFPHRGATT